jgi:hypothetical protein
MARNSSANEKASNLATDENVTAVNSKLFDAISNVLDQSGVQYEILSRAATIQAQKITEHHSDRVLNLTSDLRDLAVQFTQTKSVGSAWADYVKDAVPRVALTMDALRERGDVFLEHEAAGCPPVLAYDYEVIVDGAELDRPCNYQLLRIVPPQGIDVDDHKRPYIIIDPRAGHGGGIGGFKSDSQVGVALAKGHPVYFVSFGRDPVEGQTLADVMHAEAGYVRTVSARHPKSPQPVVTGNCQGGWATLLMAACNPDLTGPLVLNGAPVAPWSGEVGENPMRYNGGMLGGTWQPMFWSDLGNGKFDGANLVMNFEQLNPSRNYFGKYFDLYRDPEAGRQRFIDFERWWGGFFLLNEAEIRWIVEKLFVGNRLVKNTAQLEPGVPVDLKVIKAPIFVFASHGDNITPPQQALNWIAETYADEEEIRVRGQRIIYMLHEEVGHLGIFVSSKVARKEHAGLASTLETVEAMAPGLYEMIIDNIEGDGVDKSFEVRFVERTLSDVAALDDGRQDETSFAAVAQMSEVQAGAYETFGRPAVQALSSPVMARALRDAHPLRVQRAAISSSTILGKGIETLSQNARALRAPADAENPFLKWEKLTGEWIEQSMDLGRDLRDAWYEASFFAIWGGPFASWFGKKYAERRTLPDPATLRDLPEVSAVLAHMRQGGLPEAVIRILVLLADSHKGFRAEILHRWAHIFHHEAPFKSLSVTDRQRILHEQSLIATFDPKGAVDTLPYLLPDKARRTEAVDLVKHIIGEVRTPSKELEEMANLLVRVLDYNGDAETEAKPASESSPARPRKRKVASKPSLN